MMQSSPDDAPGKARHCPAPICRPAAPGAPLPAAGAREDVPESQRLVARSGHDALPIRGGGQVQHPQ